MTLIKWAPLVLLILLLSFAVYLAMLSWMTRTHPVKTASEHIIRPCTAKPNCVSSLNAQQTHRVESFPVLEFDPSFSWKALMKSIEEAGGEILVDDGHYGHAVFTSSIFRFRDDVEAVLENGRIDIRSASRAGTSDLGINRKRIESIRSRYLSLDAG